MTLLKSIYGKKKDGACHVRLCGEDGVIELTVGDIPQGLLSRLHERLGTITVQDAACEVVNQCTLWPFDEEELCKSDSQ